MDMFKSLLYLHIAGGTIGLILGLVIILLKKGDNRHHLLGNIYFFAMLISAISVFPMSYFNPNFFLCIVSIFTIYMLVTGKRFLKIRSGADVKPIDWIFAALMAVFGCVFIGYGVRNLIRSDVFGIVLVVFGFVSLQFVYQDYKNFTGKSKVKNFFLTTHFQRFMGSYIASVTAFLVVNNTLLPGVVAWLIPTVCIAPLISVWTRKYQKLVTPE
jgi:uncharacterized membrane protein